MKKSVQLAIRASEIRSEINGLEPGDATLEKRRELLEALNTVESEYRAALQTEAEAEAGAPDAQGLTAEEREFRQLESRAELRQAFRAVMNGSALTGAEKELLEHRGLSGHNIPWDLIAPRVEERADAVSAAPADSHLQQHGILARVFARSATATLGVAMPMVPTGEQNYPVITTTDNAMILAKDAAEGDTADAGITAHTIAPTRLQRSYLFRREDQAVLAGLEEALRADLSMAVSDLLDQQVLAGDGTTGAQFSGFLATAANGGIPDRSDSPARVTFALAAGEAARGIDGKYAGGLGECSIVIGDDTARDLASKFTTNGEESALAYMSRTTRATMASANIPAVASMFQEGILARMGAAGANAVCPTWDSMFMIRDEISGRKSGQIALTIGMLAGFDILRADGFDRLKFKVA
ncbi:MAG: phage major capsid protein [Alphaproteobacteria bacterium]|nr:phage major capsid protein [Alphaproteobacteria bacterium]